MRSGVPLLRICPEPWVGLAPPYDKDWTERVFKTAVQTRAWDGLSKTWWFPRSFEPVVTSAVREKNWIPDSMLDSQRQELYRDRRVPGTGATTSTFPGEVQGDTQLAKDYETLSLHPSAPPQLVDWAIAYWRHQYAALGAPPTQLMLAEEAYSRIIGSQVPGGAGGR